MPASFTASSSESTIIDHTEPTPDEHGRQPPPGMAVEVLLHVFRLVPAILVST